MPLSCWRMLCRLSATLSIRRAASCGGISQSSPACSAAAISAAPARRTAGARSRSGSRTAGGPSRSESSESAGRQERDGASRPAPAGAPAAAMTRPRRRRRRRGAVGRPNRRRRAACDRIPQVAHESARCRVAILAVLRHRLREDAVEIRRQLSAAGRSGAPGAPRSRSPARTAARPRDSGRGRSRRSRRQRGRRAARLGSAPGCSSRPSRGRSRPASVPRELVRLARPKSQRYACPSASRMFAGFRSRWISSAAWAASRAPPICSAIRSASARERGAALPDQRLQAGAVHVAHREVEDAVDLVGVVDRDHVRVVERRGELRLAEEARAKLPGRRPGRTRSPSARPCARGARASRGRRSPSRRGRGRTRSCTARTRRRRSRARAETIAPPRARSRRDPRRRTARASSAAPR